MIKLHFIIDNDENSSNFSPSFGVGYLSAYLKMHIPDIRVSLSFMTADIVKDIETGKPDIIGFSCTSRYFIEFRNIADELKKRFNIPIIWGGVHISIAPLELPQSADLGVVGEGEETVRELLTKFSDGRFHELDSIKGIIYRRDGRILINEKRPLVQPLDSLPLPDLDLLGVKWNRSSRAVMLTSRGCPYKCRFCASSIFWDKTRLHSAEYVVNAMKRLVERYQVSEILIFDDFFTIDKKRIAKIVELKKQEPLLKGVRFECLARIDNFDEYLAINLKEMGICKISFGIESGCQNTLDYLKNGKLKLQQVESVLKTAKSHGFRTVGSFVIGSPYETAAEIEETFAFIEKLDLDSVQITVATPFPGTEMWEDGKRIGKITGNDWSDNYYAMYAVDRETKPADIIDGKRLLTQIDREEFTGLLAKAIKLQNSINLTWKSGLRYYTRKFIINSGFGFILKLRKRLAGC